MSAKNGEVFNIKEAFAKYLRGWYDGLVPTTQAVEEYVGRGVERCIIFAPDRMVDAAEDMLAAYRKNDNPGAHGQNAPFPVVLVGVAKDWMPTMGDWGGRQVSRQYVRITDDVDASVYGYRQAMVDIRAQVVIFASEGPTAQSLATQILMWIGDIENRRFYADFTFGEYTVQMPLVIENPDIPFVEVKTDAKNMTILAGDISLKATIPYFDAPKAGEANDGTSHNPQGYPNVTEVDILDRYVPWKMVVTEGGIEQVDPPRPLEPFSP